MLIYNLMINTKFHNWVFHDRHSCQIIWPIFTQGRAKNIPQKLPQWGLKPGPLDHALPTELGRRSLGQEISEVSLVCFMHHFTWWTLFISRINRAWLYKGHENSGWQLNVDLAQLVEHWASLILTRDVFLHLSESTIHLVCTWFYFLLPREVPSIQSETLWLSSASQYGRQCFLHVKLGLICSKCAWLRQICVSILLEICCISIRELLDVR